jgi:hypothetical protein
MIQQFDKPAIPAVCKDLKRNATDHFIIADSLAELAMFCDRSVPSESSYRMRGEAGWYGGDNFETIRDKTIAGDVSVVPQSDKLLAQFEQYSFASARNVVIDDVVGAIPNVQAFLSGSPMSMRRKVKAQSDTAPVAVVIDLVSSASITAAQILQRGIALLAFVRAISMRRPVELWVSNGLDADGRKNAVWAFARIDTTPLELAHACYALSCVGVARALCYGMSEALHGYQGTYPYDDAQLTRKHYAEIVRSALPHVTDVVAIPVILASDPLLHNPTAWVRDQLEQLNIKDE